MRTLLTGLLTFALVATAQAMGGAGHHHSGSNDGAGPIDPPSANEFSPDIGGVWEPSRNIGIQAIHSVHLPTSELMIWGYDGADAIARAKIYDQATGDLVDIDVGKSAFCGGHAFLPDGRLMILGGRGHRGGGTYTLFDPFTRTFTPPKEQTARRYYATLTALPDGRIITFSGTGGGARTPEIYDPDTDTWKRLGCPIGAPPYAICRGAYINYNWYARVMVSPAGPVFAMPASRDFYLSSLDIPNETWTTWKIGPGRDGRFRGGPSVYFAPGKLLRAGSDRESRALATTETIIIDVNDVAHPTYHVSGPMNFARNRNNLTILPDGTVLATGGIRKAPPGQDAHVYNAEVFDPATETWTTLNAMSDHRVYHSTAILMRDGRVFSAGGERKQKTSQIFHPPYLFKGARPVISSAPEDVYYGEPFDVLTPDAPSVTQVNLLRLGAVTHTYDQSQLIAKLTFTAGVDRVTVNGPDDETYAPPGYYMLFLVSSSGVPSVAEYVKLEYEDGTPPWP